MRPVFVYIIGIESLMRYFPFNPNVSIFVKKKVKPDMWLLKT